MHYFRQKTNQLAVLSIGLGLLLWIVTIGCSPTDPNPSPVNSGEKLRYNQVIMKMTHNSYIESESDEFWVTSCIDRAKGSIESQLTLDPTKPWASATGIELDIWLTGGTYNKQTKEYLAFDWEVKHAGDLDDRNWPNFSSYLERLVAWSKANPGHNVITVKIEEKKYGDVIPGWLQNLNDFMAGIFGGAAYSDYDDFYKKCYKPNFPEYLDDYIRKHFDANLLYTPRQLKGSAATLLAGARNGWPTLGELKGKFIFYVMGNDAANNYAGDSPEDRLCFQRGGRTDDNCVFISVSRDYMKDGLNNSSFLGHIALMKNQADGKIICTYLGHHDKYCNGVLRKPAEDGHDWGIAMACDVNLIQSDVVNKTWATVGTKGYTPYTGNYSHIFYETNITDKNGATTTSAPAIIRYKDTTRVFHDKNYVPLYFTLYGNWDSQKSLGSMRVRDIPGVAIYQDKLWAFYRTKDNSNIVYITYDGSEWSKWSNPIPSVSTSKGPGVAVLDGKLWVVYPDQNGAIYFVNYNGSSWSTPKAATGKTSAAIGVCSFNGKVHLFYKSSSSENLYMGSIDASGKPGIETNLNAIINANTDKSPAAAVINDKIVVLYKSSSSDNMYRFSVDKNGDIYGRKKILGGSTTSKSPALTGSIGSRSAIWVFVGSGGSSLWTDYRSLWY